MTPDTMAVLQELEQRVSELSTALETVTESRDESKRLLDGVKRELYDAIDEVRVSRAVIDRLRIHIQQGVEL